MDSRPDTTRRFFADPASTPPSIDYEGVNASSCLGNAILDYSASFGKKKEWSAGVGLEMPLYSITDADVHGAYKVNQRVPDIPAFIRWSWDEGSGWLRLSAVMRNMLYHNPFSGKNVDKVGYGFQLSGSAQVLPGLTAYYQGLYGKGTASYIQDLAGCGMDMAPIRLQSVHPRHSEGMGGIRCPAIRLLPVRLRVSLIFPRAHIRQRLRPAFCRQPIQIRAIRSR